MKNLKRYLTILLMVCMMCSALSFMSNAESINDDVDIETTAVAEEIVVATKETIATTEAIVPELMPMRTSGCGDLKSWSDIDHATKNLILGDVLGNWQYQVGSNPDIYYNSSGTIVLCGTGSYSGCTYVTDLNRRWYL